MKLHKLSTLIIACAICLAAISLLNVVRGQTGGPQAGAAQTPGPKAAAKTNPASAGVRIWEEDVIIPTYAIGDPEPNPIFYFGKQSQGAQGRVYPYPLYDNLTFKKENKKYRFVHLENEFVRIGILPEVGGRLFEAVDKTNNYDFIYRQHVIKPALIGLIGAWISGGIEWNIPHHHRATTALPVEYKLEEIRTAARPYGSANWRCARACAGRWDTRCARAHLTWRPSCEFSIARRWWKPCCASPTWRCM